MKSRDHYRANAPRWHAVRDAPRHMLALTPRTQDRTQSVQKGIPTRSMGTMKSRDHYRANAPRWHAVRDAPRHMLVLTPRTQDRTQSV
ncbi:hypothetical protein ALP98_200076 [Pseudomonas viridiflava]|uniref:Uncharacterized protein n=1 Tax=Pseudomonas viridiflava TaxID=33069 RepID=A0A3M4NXH4_PSEVI|nr:hypothetical protein ALP98_200076 [Pseudomonas viridiflava]